MMRVELPIHPTQNKTERHQIFLLPRELALPEHTDVSVIGGSPRQSAAPRSVETKVKTPPAGGK